MLLHATAQHDQAICIYFIRKMSCSSQNGVYESAHYVKRWWPVENNKTVRNGETREEYWMCEDAAPRFERGSRARSHNGKHIPRYWRNWRQGGISLRGGVNFTRTETWTRRRRRRCGRSRQGSGFDSQGCREETALLSLAVRSRSRCSKYLPIERNTSYSSNKLLHHGWFREGQGSKPGRIRRGANEGRRRRIKRLLPLHSRLKLY